MVLKAELDEKGFNALPEADKAHYAKRDGVYRVDIEGVNGWELDNVVSLRNAISTERTRRQDAEALYQQIPESLRKDPQAAISALERITKGKFKDEDERKAAIDAALKPHLDKFTSDLESKDKILKQREAQLVKTLGADRLRMALLANGLEAGKEVLAIPSLLENLEPVIAEGKDVDIRVIDPATKQPRITQVKGQTGEMTIDEFAGTVKLNPIYSGLFAEKTRQGSGSSDSRSSHSGGGGGKGAGTTQDPLVIPASNKEMINANFEKISKGEAIVDFET
jgi:hypothetical protein